MIKLGVNVDHVATVRQARREPFPDPADAANLAVAGGADGITAHLREDRRHIQDEDLYRLKSRLSVPLNMEMATTPEIVSIACRLGPAWVCLVPEKRQELTTEGGLNLASTASVLQGAIRQLKKSGIKVSLFVEPENDTVDRAADLGADAVELHTGTFAGSFNPHKPKVHENQLKRLVLAAERAKTNKLLVNAGHGLSYDNVSELARVYPFNEFNIGFAIVARALMVGMKQAVAEMKQKLNG